jgi:hypothetical protein
MPLKSGSLIHIQNAYTEAIAEAIKGWIGSGYNPAVVYILQGMVNSGSGSNFAISAGSCFYNGEVFLFDGATFTAGATQTAVLTIGTTFFSGTNADGVQFTDGITRNIHQIRKVVCNAALGGSGISNYNDCQRVNTNIPQVNLINGTNISITGTYPNLTITNTQASVNKVVKSGYIYIGDLNTTPADPNCILLAGSTNGLSAYRYNFPAALPDANWLPYGTIGNSGHSDWGGFNDNFMCTLQIGAYDNAGFYFAISTTAAGNTQFLAIKYLLIAP